MRGNFRCVSIGSLDFSIIICHGNARKRYHAPTWTWLTGLAAIIIILAETRESNLSKSLHVAARKAAIYLHYCHCTLVTQINLTLVYTHPTTNHASPCLTTGLPGPAHSAFYIDGLNMNSCGLACSCNTTMNATSLAFNRSLADTADKRATTELFWKYRTL